MTAPISADSILAAAREAKKDAVVIGEVWEDGSNKIAYSRRRKYLLGHETHGLMNYPFRNAVLAFLRGGDAADFRETMETIRENYPPAAFYSLMNFLGTHDTGRILTVLGAETVPEDKEARSEYRLSESERQLGTVLLRLATLLLYTCPGSPTIFYGDEAGMEGFEDPFNRRTFPWGREDRALTGWFRALGRARHRFAALRKGDIRYVRAAGPVLAFTRTWEEDTVLCACNAGRECARVTLPWSAAEIGGLLCFPTDPDTGEAVVELPPLTGYLLRKSPGRE